MRLTKTVSRLVRWLNCSRLIELATGKRAGIFTRAWRGWSIRRYATMRPTKRAEPCEVLGTIFTEFATAINRLGKNATLPEDAEQYIKSELGFCVNRYLRETSQSVLAPRSTNSGRRKRGLSSLKLQRTRRRVDYSDWDAKDATLPLEEAPTLRPPGKTLGGKLYRVPSPRFESERDVDLRLDINAVCRTPLERDVVGLRGAGYNRREVAASLGVPRRRIAAILKILQERLENGAHE